MSRKPTLIDVPAGTQAVKTVATLQEISMTDVYAYIFLTFCLRNQGRIRHRKQRNAGRASPWDPRQMIVSSEKNS